MAAPGGGTLAKAMQVLDMVAEHGRPVRFAEIQQRAEFPRATLFRLVQSLTTEGLLHFDEQSHCYSPGLRLLQFAHSAWSQTALGPAAEPFIDQIALETGETIHLAQMVRGQVIYVDKRNAQSPVEMFSQAGKVGPGYCTGVGKAIMAFLPTKARADALAMQPYYQHTNNTITSAELLNAELDQIHAEGVAFDREEHEPGIICVAVPILTEANIAIGAISITGSTQNKSLEDLRSFETPLRECAAEIAHVARISQFPQTAKGK